MEKMATVVSVVRDRAMYDRCVLSNSCLEGSRLVAYDNNLENLPIGVRYNTFLDTLTGSDDFWIVFCHEDWRLDEALPPLLLRMDRNAIYGPVGIALHKGPTADYCYRVGAVSMANKNGEGMQHFHFSDGLVGASTLDCQCVIVHSSLVLRHNLRFDPDLPFDMYVEDFCAAAYLRHGIPTYALTMKCTHFSYGVTGDSFNRALSCVREKYADSPHRYVTTVGYNNGFGGKVSRKLHLSRFPRLHVFFAKNRANKGLEPKVSIIVPAFNAERYIAETLDSVLRQTYRNFECIVVDDGSSDGTADVVRRYCKRDSRIRLVLQSNAGPSAARNRAIKLSRGEFILPLDADDRIHPLYVGTALSVFAMHPDVRLVYCRASYFGAVKGKWHLPAYDYDRMTAHNCIFVSCMYRRSDAVRVGLYDETFRQGYEDWDFLLRLLGRDDRVVRIPMHMFYYRQHPVAEGSVNTKAAGMDDELLARIEAKYPDIYGPGGGDGSLIKALRSRLR